MTANPFHGFPGDLPRYLARLEKKNNKPWFERHRGDYESLFVEPAKQFVSAMAAALRRIAPDVKGEPRINGSIMRINRDVRFSKDKSPYRPSLQILFPEGPKFDRGRPAFLFRLDRRNVGLGAGMCGFAPEQLGAFREAVLDPAKGAALVKAVGACVDQDAFELHGEHYKRVPHGFDPDHPRGRFLRLTSLHIGGDRPIPGELFTPDAVGFCLDTYQRLRPVQAWLVSVVP